MVGERGAVVLLGVGGGGEGDLALVDREGAGDRLDRELGGHVVAVGVLDDGRAGDVGRVGAGVGGGGGGGEAGDGVGLPVLGELERLEAGDRVLGAVVEDLVGLGLDGDLVLGVAVGDAELALDGGDGVVGGLGAVVQRVGEEVGGAADQGLAAGHVVGRALAVGPAVAGDGDVVVGERGAVVLLGVGGGGEGDLALVDLEGAVYNSLVTKRVVLPVDEEVAHAHAPICSSLCCARRCAIRSADGHIVCAEAHRIGPGIST